MKYITIKCVILACFLVSCASVSDVNRESERLSMDKGYGAAVQYLKQQLKQDPNNTETQALLAHCRDVWISELVIEADQLRGSGNYEDASQHYQLVLSEDPNNSRALSGLGSIKRDQRHAQWVKDARAAIAKEQVDQASLLVKQVLDEDPHNADALALKQEMDEQRYHDSMVSLQLKTGFKKPISLEFRDQNLRSIFEVISRTANINFIFDRDMPTDLKATIFARNTTVEDALRVLLVTNRLDKKLLNDNTVLIYQNTPDKQRDYQELVTKAFYVNYADIKQTLNLIKLMVKTNDVYIDERLNMIVMRDTPDAIRIAEKLIAANDLPDPEVVLDIQVLQVDDTHAHALGLTFPTSISAGLQSTGTSTSSSTSTSTSSSSGITAYDLHNLSMSNITITGLSQLLALSLQESDSSTHTLANPRVRVKNKEKAKILIGDKIPIVTTSTANTVTSSSVQYQDVGLKLDAEPVVRIDNTVTIKLSLEVSSITQTIQQPAASGTGTNTFYEIGTRSADTVLQLRDGETEVLAGLISHDEANTSVRVPGLGDIPVLGRVFGSNTVSKESNEIVLLITPHVVRSLERPAANITEFSSGTAAQITDQPLRLNATENVSLDPKNTLTFPAPTSSTTTAPVTTPVAAPAAQPMQASVGSAVASVAGAEASVASGSPQTPTDSSNGSSGRVSLVAPASISAGGELTIAMQLDGQRALKGVNGRITFPAGQVEVVNVLAGNLMSGNGQPVTLDKHIGNDAVSFHITNAQPILGSGPVVSVVFHLLPSASAGALQFAMDGVTASDPSGQAFGMAFGPPVSVKVTK